MAAETGHHANRVYRDQSGDLHLNGASLFDTAENDIAPALNNLGGTGFLHVDLVAGAVAGNHTVTGIAVGDEIVFVGHFSTLAAIATLADLTSEFTVDSADTIDNTAGTDTSSDQLQVIWIDKT